MEKTKQGQVGMGQRSLAQETWRRFKRNRLAIAGMVFIGVLLGRVVCGFLCPFGWFQELLHKIPTKKFSTKRFHILTHLKYGILLLFVIILPITGVNEGGMGDPFYVPPGSWRAVSPCPWLIPASGPVWGGSSPGRAASCWGSQCCRCSSTGHFANGCVPWGPFTACATRYPFTGWR